MARNLSYEDDRNYKPLPRSDPIIGEGAARESGCRPLWCNRTYPTKLRFRGLSGRRTGVADLVAAFFQLAPRRQEDPFFPDGASELRVSHRFQVLEAEIARGRNERELVGRPGTMDDHHSDPGLEVPEHLDESGRLRSLLPVVAEIVKVVDDR